MNISSYADLLEAARQQPEPQRLLFVFAQAELPQSYTEVQSQQFQAGTGGVLTPRMSTDKALDELGEFSALVEESRRTGQDWKIVFVAALAGRVGVAPSTEDAQAPLKTMVNAIQNGAIANYLAFDCEGELVRFS